MPLTQLRNLGILANAGITTTKLGTGAVLQVVTGEFASSFTTTSSSFVDTGLTASITPSSTSNKILVLLDSFGCNNTANRSMFLNIVRTSTNIVEKGVTVNASASNYSLNLITLDSPSSTSSVTYKMQIKTDGSGTVNINDTSAVSQRKSSITLLEIKA